MAPHPRTPRRPFPSPTPRCRLRNAAGENEQLLRLINSSSETPYLIWNATVRGELIDFVDAQLRLNYASPSRSPLEAAESFVFNALQDELKVSNRM